MNSRSRRASAAAAWGRRAGTRLEPLLADHRSTRLINRLPLILQAAGGAALAWFIAAQLLGHAMPFFAPVTAMICLGLTYGNRVRRVAELTVGVAIGVVVCDIFVHFAGVGIWQIAAVCIVAMSLVVLAGAGKLLVLQAGTQGVIVATLVSSDGQAFSRWIDAVAGWWRWSSQWLPRLGRRCVNPPRRQPPSCPTLPPHWASVRWDCAKRILSW